MIADRSLRENQLGSDLCQAGPEERSGEHLAFPAGQRVGPLTERRQSQFWVHHPFTCHHPTKSHRQIRGWGILEQEADDSTLHSPLQIATASKGGQDYRAAGGKGLA